MLQAFFFNWANSSIVSLYMRKLQLRQKKFACDMNEYNFYMNNLEFAAHAAHD